MANFNEFKSITMSSFNSYGNDAIKYIFIYKFATLFKVFQVFHFIDDTKCVCL